MRMYVLSDQSHEPFHIDHKHLPETNKSHLKNCGWRMNFLLGELFLRCELIVLGRVYRTHKIRVKKQWREWKCWGAIPDLATRYRTWVCIDFVSIELESNDTWEILQACGSDSILNWFHWFKIQSSPTIRPYKTSQAWVEIPDEWLQPFQRLPFQPLKEQYHKKNMPLQKHPIKKKQNVHFMRWYSTWLAFVFKVV